MNRIKGIMPVDLFRKAYPYDTTDTESFIYKGVLYINSWRCVYDTGDRSLAANKSVRGVIEVDGDSVDLIYSTSHKSYRQQEFHVNAIIGGMDESEGSVAVIEGRLLDAITELSKITSNIIVQVTPFMTVAKLYHDEMVVGDGSKSTVIEYSRLRSKNTCAALVFSQHLIDASYLKVYGCDNGKSIVTKSSNGFCGENSTYPHDIIRHEIHEKEPFVVKPYKGFPLTVTDGDVEVYREKYEALKRLYGDNLYKIGVGSRIAYISDDLIVSVATI